MTEFLYEKDLRAMQFNILVSTRHDLVIGELAGRYGLEKQRLRRLLIEKLDMILLENIPARYEAWVRVGDAGDEVARTLGQELLTRYIPLIDAESMQTIMTKTKAMMNNDIPAEQALARGMEEIREALRS
jgi:energy-converting hydrogenase A subunit M